MSMVTVLPPSGFRSYNQLKHRVRETLLLGQQKIEQAKVQTYWETGNLILQHIQRHTPEGKERAEYNRKIIEKLAADMNLEQTLLYRCVRFAREFKKVATWQLSWSHYRALLGISDDRKRLELTHRAGNHEWTARELAEEIKKISKNGNRSESATELLIPRRGEVYTYRLAAHEKIHAGKTDLRLDLGFSSYREAAMKGVEKFKAGDVVTSKWIKEDTYKLATFSPKPGIKEEDSLFTYYAYIERVVDGDTLRAQVDLGFGIWTRQYLRLRGIDAPELDTAEGKRAKRFVETELAGAPYVLITSTKSDKYDRYLADVFYGKDGTQFLNNNLLAQKLADRIQ